MPVAIVYARWYRWAFATSQQSWPCHGIKPDHDRLFRQRQRGQGQAAGSLVPQPGRDTLFLYLTPRCSTVLLILLILLILLLLLLLLFTSAPHLQRWIFLTRHSQSNVSSLHCSGGNFRPIFTATARRSISAVCAPVWSIRLEDDFVNCLRLSGARTQKLACFTLLTEMC